MPQSPVPTLKQKTGVFNVPWIFKTISLFWSQCFEHQIVSDDGFQHLKKQKINSWTKFND